MDGVSGSTSGQLSDFWTGQAPQDLGLILQFLWILLTYLRKLASLSLETSRFGTWDVLKVVLFMMNLPQKSICHFLLG